MQLLLCVKTSGGVGLLVACMTFLAMATDPAAVSLRQDILCFFFSSPLFSSPDAHDFSCFLFLPFVSIISSPLQQA